MTAQVATMPTPGVALHQAVEQFSESASEPLHLEQHRERFNEKALRDVTNTSADGFGINPDHSNPLIIKGEMQAQKDYFRRLKFTYLEQEAKRNFLASIMGDSPQGVQHRENEELEEVNAGKKQALKELKEDIHQMAQQAITLAQENMARNIVIKKRLAEAQSLQKQIREAELELARIKAKHPVDNRLTIDQASEALANIDEEMNKVVETTEITKRNLAAASDEVKRTAKEVARLNNDRAREEARAKEVQEGREAGDTKVDDLCRWLTASTEYYMTLMGIRSVQSSSEGNAQLLHLEYDVAGSVQPVTLVLRFQAASKRLVGAQLLNSNIDISRQVDNAVRSNDVPGLVGDVLGLVRAPDA